MQKLIEPLEEFELTSAQLADIRDGMKQPFWKTMVKLLKEEKLIAEVAVFENEDLNDEQRDDLRLRRNLLAYVIDLPKLVLAKAERKPETKEVDFETYESDEN